MSKAPVMPFFIGLYMSDTQHLTTEQHGAYFIMLITLWNRDCKPIADDERLLCRITGLSRSKWRKHRPVIEQFFKIENGVWRHSRLEREYKKVVCKINAKRPSYKKPNAPARPKSQQEDAFNKMADSLGKKFREG